MPVVKVSDDMEQESLYLPQNGFVGRRKVAICMAQQQKEKHEYKQPVISNHQVERGEWRLIAPHVYCCTYRISWGRYFRRWQCAGRRSWHSRCTAAHLTESSYPSHRSKCTVCMRLSQVRKKKKKQKRGHFNINANIKGRERSRGQQRKQQPNKE